MLARRCISRVRADASCGFSLSIVPPSFSCDVPFRDIYATHLSRVHDFANGEHRAQPVPRGPVEYAWNQFKEYFQRIEFVWNRADAISPWLCRPEFHSRSIVRLVGLAIGREFSRPRSANQSACCARLALRVLKRHSARSLDPSTVNVQSIIEDVSPR